LRVVVVVLVLWLVLVMVVLVVVFAIGLQVAVAIADVMRDGLCCEKGGRGRRGQGAGMDDKVEEKVEHVEELLVPCSLPLGTRGGQRSTIRWALEGELAGWGFVR
jgi:hypothetical protein